MKSLDYRPPGSIVLVKICACHRFPLPAFYIVVSLALSCSVPPSLAHASLYLHMRKGMCTHTYVHAHIYIHASIHPGMHTYTHTQIHTYTHTHTHTYTYIHTYIDLCVCVRIYIYIYICIESERKREREVYIYLYVCMYISLSLSLSLSLGGYVLYPDIFFWPLSLSLPFSSFCSVVLYMLSLILL